MRAYELIAKLSSIVTPKVYALTSDLIPLMPISTLLPAEAGEGILVGYDELGRPIYLDFEKLPNAHGVITGTTGSGKSTLARSLALSVYEEGVRVLFVDPHGEHCQFVEKFGGISLDLRARVLDITQPPGISPSQWSLELSKAAKHVLSLTESQRAILQDALLEAIEQGTLERALRYLEARRHDPLLEELYVKVRTLLKPFMRPCLNLEELLNNELVSLVLGGGALGLTYEHSVFLTWTVLAQLEYFMRSRGVRSGLELVVVIDEAHRLFVLGPENVLVRAFQETRKFGYGFWALNQLPSQIPLEVYQLVGFLIFLPGPKEYVDELASLALLSEDDRDFLLFGIRGTGIVVRQGDPRPRRLRLAIREEAIIR